MAVDAEIQETFAVPDPAGELPEGLVPTGVSGDGLIDWTVADGRRAPADLARAPGRPPPRLDPMSDDPLRIGVRTSDADTLGRLAGAAGGPAGWREARASRRFRGPIARLGERRTEAGLAAQAWRRARRRPAPCCPTR